MFNKKEKETIKRDLHEKDTDVPKHPNRKFGQWGHDKKKKLILYCGLIIIIIIALVIAWQVNYGVIVPLIVFAIGMISIPIYLFVIKIPYSCVLVVYLDEEKLIDAIEIVYIPIHLIYWEYDVVGNHVPLQNVNSDGGYIYIADKFDKDNKIIHLSWDNKYSNLRYIAHKGAFLEAKKELKDYGIKNLRRIMVEDVTVMGMVEQIIEKFNDALFTEPEKYYRKGTFDQNEILGLEQQIIDKLADTNRKGTRQNIYGDEFTSEKTNGDLNEGK